MYMYAYIYIYIYIYIYMYVQIYIYIYIYMCLSNANKTMYKHMLGLSTKDIKPQTNKMQHPNPHNHKQCKVSMHMCSCKHHCMLSCKQTCATHLHTHTHTYNIIHDDNICVLCAFLMGLVSPNNTNINMHINISAIQIQRSKT